MVFNWSVKPLLTPEHENTTLSRNFGIPFSIDIESHSWKNITLLLYIGIYFIASLNVQASRSKYFKFHLPLLYARLFHVQSPALPVYLSRDQDFYDSCSMATTCKKTESYICCCSFFETSATERSVCSQTLNAVSQLTCVNSRIELLEFGTALSLVETTWYIPRIACW